MMRTALALLLLSACSSEGVIGERTPRGGDLPDGPVQLDVLFVIDNSGSMSEEQVSLITNFNNFIDALSVLPAGVPDLHIAVVSSDVGIDPFLTTGCGGHGDDGQFQHIPRSSTCTPPSGAFIIDETDPISGGHVTNYPTTATLQETFSCIARLGSTGCGFEQHFESMKRALDGHQPENAGFLRDDAFLAVIFVADEDDCSSADGGAVYDPAQNELTDPLGPFGSFRCSEFGMLCDGAPIARSPASYAACEPAPTGYLRHPSEYVTFLNGLKSDPNKIVVAAIVGNTSPVEVASNPEGNPEMMPSCSSANGSAIAGIRFHWFLSQFPGRNAFTSICDDDLSVAVTTVGAVVHSAIIDYPTQPDAGVPGVDGGESSGCSAGGRSAPAGAALVLFAGLLILTRRRRVG